MGYKKIGVLGGMGPESSASFYKKIIRYCQKNYYAVQDSDFPPLFLYSLPLDGFNELGVVDEKVILKQLFHGLSVLKRSGCDFVVMPCNTIHCFIDELRTRFSIPILSIVEETIEKITGNKDNVVGLLGSDTTLKLNLYQGLLHKKGISCITPNESEKHHITSLILEVMSGKVENKTKKNFLSVINRMEEQSAKAVVFGCTEIPLAVSQEDVNIKVYDTLQILAESAVDYSVTSCY